MSYVLVVTTAEHDDDALRNAVGPDDHVKVVVPALKQGLLDWLANDERAFSTRAEADERAAELPAEDVDTAAGEANIALAIRDALATFPADEVVVAVGPGERDDDVTARLDPEEGAARSIDGVPLRLIVVPD